MAKSTLLTDPKDSLSFILVFLATMKRAFSEEEDNNNNNSNNNITTTTTTTSRKPSEYLSFITREKRYLEKAKNNKCFSVAFIGTRGIGKSAAINALLGFKEKEGILPSGLAVLPITNVVIFVRSHTDDFYEITDRTTRECLYKGSDKKEATHVLREIKRVDAALHRQLSLSGPFPNLPPELELIDMPATCDMSSLELHILLSQVDAIVMIDGRAVGNLETLRRVVRLALGGVNHSNVSIRPVLFSLFYHPEASSVLVDTPPPPSDWEEAMPFSSIKCGSWSKMTSEILLKEINEHYQSEIERLREDLQMVSDEIDELEAHPRGATIEVINKVFEDARQYFEYKCLFFDFEKVRALWLRFNVNSTDSTLLTALEADVKFADFRDRTLLSYYFLQTKIMRDILHQTLLETLTHMRESLGITVSFQDFPYYWAQQCAVRALFEPGLVNALELYTKKEADTSDGRHRILLEALGELKARTRKSMVKAIDKLKFIFQL